MGCCTIFRWQAIELFDALVWRGVIHIDRIEEKHELLQ